MNIIAQYETIICPQLRSWQTFESGEVRYLLSSCSEFAESPDNHDKNFTSYLPDCSQHHHCCCYRKSWKKGKFCTPFRFGLVPKQIT